MSDLRQGIVFVATGAKYLSEAVSSARRTRICSKCPICIFTDLIDEASRFDCFDIILPIDQPLFTYGDKIPPLARSPFDQTLFLDTDAFLLDCPSKLLCLLKNFDLCASFSPVRKPDGWNSSVPLSIFPEYNTGVILYKKNQINCNLFESWNILYQDLFAQYDQSWDQASFRETLWKYITAQGIRFYTLPQECNLRLTKPWTAGKGMKVSVVHGRIPDKEYPILKSYLNSDVSFFRTWSGWQQYYPSTCLTLKVPPDPRPPFSFSEFVP